MFEETIRSHRGVSREVLSDPRLLALGGAVAYKNWKRKAGAGRATFLTALYLGAFGAAHPLAKKLGAWPAVYTVTAVTALSSIVIGRKRQK